MKIVLCVITYNRSREFRRCLQYNVEFLKKMGLQVQVITVHNDCNQDDKSFVQELFSGICLMPAENLGVAGGRNLIISKIEQLELADDPALFIDDDAILNELPISVLSDSSCDIIACKSLNKSLSPRFNELP